MGRTIRIGRWEIELYQRALHLFRGPDPHCTRCGGTGGGWVPTGHGPDWDGCACLDDIRTWRLPLWRRTRGDEEAPF
ncbi:hypothetical protein ACH4FX_38905 [Streptomyces sp. NPDC018019]|uniref:hypothetical protein n=1 Tax=Streptomyces sp. NPDC018019 TaxID=3365030 RepID=UPI00378DABDA